MQASDTLSRNLPRRSQQLQQLWRDGDALARKAAQVVLQATQRQWVEVAQLCSDAGDIFIKLTQAEKAAWRATKAAQRVKKQQRQQQQQQQLVQQQNEGQQQKPARLSRRQKRQQKDWQDRMRKVEEAGEGEGGEEDVGDEEVGGKEESRRVYGPFAPDDRKFVAVDVQVSKW